MEVKHHVSKLLENGGSVITVARDIGLSMDARMHIDMVIKDPRIDGDLSFLKRCGAVVSNLFRCWSCISSFRLLLELHELAQGRLTKILNDAPPNSKACT